MTQEQQVVFVGGTKRTGRKPPYFLVPVELCEAVAWTRLEGDRKYLPGNWEHGDKEFFVDCLSHAIEHLMEYRTDASEDHLGHAATNIGFILWALKRGKVTREDFQNAANVLTFHPTLREQYEGKHPKQDRRGAEPGTSGT